MQAQFIGLGYIGLPTAAIVAQQGVKVTGVDVNSKVVETINRGEIHIVEPGLEDVVKMSVDRGFFKASLTPGNADVHLFSITSIK